MTTTLSPVREPTTGVVVRATALAATLTVLGSMLGLLRDLLLARFFGATGHTDAFLVAWTVPETASPLLIEGAMAYLMIPIFVRALADEGSLRGVVRSTLPRITGLLALGAAFVALAAPVLVRLLAPGLSEPALATSAMRVTALTILTFGIAGYLGAALRSRHIFSWPASIYLAYNVGILAAMVSLRVPLGVFSAAIGVAVGGLLMVAVQVPAFARSLAPAPTGRTAGRPHVALLAFVPIAVFTLTRHAQVFVERILGSQLSPGTISHLNFAQKVAQVPMMLAIVVATVTFPMLAHSIATGDEGRTRQRSERDLQTVGAVVLIATAFIVAYATPIIQLLFEHGAFGPRDTAATAGIMRVYALGLLGQAAVGVLARSYASGRRRLIWLPTIAMGAGLAITILLGVTLLPYWHAVAIAAGNAAGITVTAALMLVGLRGSPARVSVPAMGRSTARLVAMTGAATVAGWVAARLTAGLPTPIVLALGGLVVVATFLLAGVAVRAEETRPVTELIRRVVGGAAPPVLMYHSIGGGDDPYRITVSPERFAAQMRWLRRRRLSGRSMRELLDAAGRGSAAGMVGLTFDDGYEDFTTRALPVLMRHGFTATVFVVAGNVGRHNEWEDRGELRRLMGADQIRDAARAGMEIGSHGLRHRRLADVDAATLDEETRHSRDVLEVLLGAAPQGFCYPYGEAPDGAIAAVREAGYAYAVATRRSGRADRYALPRIYVGERDGPWRLRAKLIRHRLSWDRYT